MKKLILLASVVGAFSMTFAQSVIGSYTQSAFIAPDQIRDAAKTDVKITQDKTQKNKIWVANLIGGSTFYALANASNEDKAVYSVPAQTVGGYAVKLGCVIFDKEENQVAIALNNKSQCFGISQSDYDNVSVSKKGVKAGGVKVGSNGEISAGGTKVGKNGVDVDVKGALAGVQYVGSKN
ncbi:hypothetical protein [Soonwooa sp.]|uniref:hypothetical protein n=1 Tax=Soonwooa sp. TaxID=1938592 RepID=UPI00262720F8|nr:hypothetical protein [Soonwooa sp.]